MPKAIKAALLSALVFPGAGHFWVKSYLTGSLLTAAACAGLYFLIAQVVERARQLTEIILAGDLPQDVAAIMALVDEQAAAPGLQTLPLASTALTVVWLIGIVDSYRLGRRQEHRDAAAG